MNPQDPLPSYSNFQLAQDLLKTLYRFCKMFYKQHHVICPCYVSIIIYSYSTFNLKI